jgi:hypothetical protein
MESGPLQLCPQGYGPADVKPSTKVRNGKGFPARLALRNERLGEPQLAEWGVTQNLSDAS